jgi:hypothetical protein
MDQVWTFTTMTIPLEAAWSLQPRALQVQTLNSGSGGLFCSTENYRLGGMAWLAEYRDWRTVILLEGISVCINCSSRSNSG